jgi:hypothetical protein
MLANRTQKCVTNSDTRHHRWMIRSFALTHRSSPTESGTPSASSISEPRPHSSAAAIVKFVVGSDGVYAVTLASHGRRLVSDHYHDTGRVTLSKKFEEGSLVMIARRRLLVGGGALTAGLAAPSFVALARAAASEIGGWVADPDVVAQWERDRPGFIYDEADVPSYVLPDPLLTLAGWRVGSRDGWVKRRREVLELFRTHVYGRRPTVEESADELRQSFEVIEVDRSAMNGAATLKRILIKTAHPTYSHQFEVIVFLPNDHRRGVPVFLLMNNRAPENTDPTRQQRSDFWPAEQVIARGYGIAALQVGDLAPDTPAGFRDGIIGLYEGNLPEGSRKPDAWAALSAWGWGASRAMDYFEKDPGIDSSRVALVGHSRGGKASLWAAAEDKRFTLVISNCSGRGGASLSRRQFGETVAEINRNFPHWFCGNFKQYNGAEDMLPVDQHMLMALIAPRPLYVTNADTDLWADPRGSFLALAHSSSVYGLWNHAPISPESMPGLNSPLFVGPRAYHIRSGEHNMTTQDWGYFTDFADTLWR